MPTTKWQIVRGGWIEERIRKPGQTKEAAVQAFADAVGVRTRSVYTWLKGTNEKPAGIEDDNLQSLLNVLGMSRQQLLAQSALRKRGRAESKDDPPKNPSFEEIGKLASPAMGTLKERNGVNWFAIDDSLELSASPGYQGWPDGEIVLDIKAGEKIELPEELRGFYVDHEDKIVNRFGAKDRLYYRPSSFLSWNSDRECEVTLVPEWFRVAVGVPYLLDERSPELAADVKSAIRDRFAETTLDFVVDRHPDIPGGFNVNGIILTRDDRLLIVRRAKDVAWYAGQWCVGIGEMMRAADIEAGEVGDATLLECVLRMCESELKLVVSAADCTPLSIIYERPAAAVIVVWVVRVNADADTIISRSPHAEDSTEAALVDSVSTKFDDLADLFFEPRDWGPTFRLFTLQIMSHLHGHDRTINHLESVLRSSEESG